MPKIILVTGASSGFGLELVKDILARGDIAIGTIRRPASSVPALSSLSTQYPDTFLLLQLDISKVTEREEVFKKIEEKWGKLDVVINNAGVVGPIGEFEALKDEEMRGVFETNFFATLSMSQLAFKFFRDTNKVSGGRLLQISSFVGYANYPGCAIYNASKAALESATASFAAELDPAWNIKVTLIEPGAYATGVIKNQNSWVNPPHPAYTSPTLPVNGMREMLKTFSAPGIPANASKAILKVVDLKDEEVPLRQAVGSDSTDAILAGCEVVRKQIEDGKDLAAEGDGKKE